MIPSKLRTLIIDSPFEGPTLELVNSIRTLAADNKTPFFPAFTDHGLEHIGAVLNATELLVPEEAWPLLTATDGAVMICATFLHDIAMHIHPAGFQELVEDTTEHGPCLWFSDAQEGRSADLPWARAWTTFQQEVRHMGSSEMELLLGAPPQELPQVAFQRSLSSAQWVEADMLVVGEFIRRHHARLAHEIALAGFPGLPPEDFPILSERLPEVADAIGLVARSHGEPLRTMAAFLDFAEPGNKRPMGAWLHFHMALLRVADYLQIEADRAPPLLLRLKSPVSPQSISEWNRHGAVSAVAWQHSDPEAIYVTISSRHGLRTHLALRQLLHDMQRELDTAAAVLSEVYSPVDLRHLRLTRHRILSNLDEQSLHAQLPYVARAGYLRSDPDLFRLLVRHLYGSHPVVAGRELVQNAVDAVRANNLAGIHASRDARPHSDTSSPVVVTLEETRNGQCVLRVCDQGTGMSPDVVIDYFLRAGASLGPTHPQLDELDRTGRLNAMKTGRFGIGAFAAFLLGSELTLYTRNASTARGVQLTVSLDEPFVQLDWCECSVGTEITIPFDSSGLSGPQWTQRDRGSPEKLLRDIASLYRLESPRVEFVHVLHDTTSTISGPADVPNPANAPTDSWRSVVRVEPIDAVLWNAHHHHAAVIHNGIAVKDLNAKRSLGDEAYAWLDPHIKGLLHAPNVAVFDSRHILSLSLTRYSLTESVLPFEDRLLESIGQDILAHGIARGPALHPIQRDLGGAAAYSASGWIPLLPGLLHEYVDDCILVLWNVDAGSADARRAFFSADGPISWERFPIRSVFTATDIEDAFERAARIGQIIGAESFGSTPRSSIDRRLETRLDPRLGVSESSSKRLPPVVAKELVAAQNALERESDARPIHMSIFRGPGLGSSAQSCLAKTWREVVGGFLPRDSRRLKGALKNSSPELDALAATWAVAEDLGGSSEIY